MMINRRNILDIQKRLFLVAHRLALRLGIIVLPNHYYIGYPGVEALTKNKERWAKRSRLPGITLDLQKQCSFVQSAIGPYRDEYADGGVYDRAMYEAAGPGYGPIEAQALYGMLRFLKPKTIVEVGCGLSTHVMRQAINRNTGEGVAKTRHICIEPYATPWLRSSSVELIERPVQEVDRSVFDSLEQGDLLFIDSSHAIATDSDVNYLYLEILPTLQSGVIVHIHDIYLPFSYTRDTLMTFVHPQETVLLQAFLSGNRDFEILFCMSLMHYDAPDMLKAVFPLYDPEPADNGLVERRPFEPLKGHFPSSMYLVKRDGMPIAEPCVPVRSTGLGPEA